MDRVKQLRRMLKSVEGDVLCLVYLMRWKQSETERGSVGSASKQSCGWLKPDATAFRF